MGLALIVYAVFPLTYDFFVQIIVHLWIPGFFFSPAERKSRSYQLELLYNYHVRMLQRHHQEAKLSKLLQSVTAGLQIYPCNPELFSSLVELSHLYAVPYNLRRILDEVSKK